MKQELLINEIFEDLVKQLEEILPEFGKRLAIDSKAIPSFAKHQNKNETGAGSTMPIMGRKNIKEFIKTGRRGKKS